MVQLLNNKRILQQLTMKRERQDRVSRSRQKKRRPHHDWKPHGHHQQNRPTWKQNKSKVQRQHHKPISQINRTQTCPFLVKIYYAINDTNHYSNDKPIPKDRQLKLYLWMNVSLKQLVELMRAHLPTIRTKQRFVLSRLHKSQGKLVKKEMGTIMVHKKSDGNDDKTLQENGFTIGDCIDASINYK